MEAGGRPSGDFCSARDSIATPPVSYSLPSLVFEGAEVLSMLGVPEVEA